MVISLNNQELIKLVYELVMKEIAKLQENQSGYAVNECSSCEDKSKSLTPAPEQRGAVASIEISKKVLAENDVKQAHKQAACEIIVPQKAIVTCLAAEYANRCGITIKRKHS